MTENNKALTRDFLIFLAVSFALFLIKYPIEMSDFRVYYLTGERVLSGENVYNVTDKLEFKYLPVTALIFSIFGIIDSVEVAIIIWYFLNTILIFLVLYKSIKLVRGHYDYKLFYGLFILFSLYLVRGLLLGQMNMLMVLLVLLTIEQLINGKERKAGIFLGLSILIKPYTLIFLPYFLISRNYKAFLFSFIILVMGLFSPFVVFGLQGGIEVYHSCFQLLNTTSDELYKSIDNVSIWSFYAKYLSDLTHAKFFAVVTILIVYAIFLFFAGKKRALEKETILMDGAILLTLIPLFSPQGWFYQLTTGLLSIQLLFVYFDRLPLAAKIGLITALLIIPLSMYDVSGKVISRGIANLSILTLSFSLIVYLNIKLRLKTYNINYKSKDDQNFIDMNILEEEKAA